MAVVEEAVTGYGARSMRMLGCWLYKQCGRSDLPCGPGLGGRMLAVERHGGGNEHADPG